MLAPGSTEFFFDRAAVKAQVLAMGNNYRAVDRGGALVRTIARGMIRRVKKRTTISPAGQAPRSRDPAGRYKRIIYAWDNTTKSVVIGHIGYRVRGNSSTVPSTHEFGKTVHVKRPIRRKKDVGRNISKWKRGRRNRAYQRLLRTFGPHQEPHRNERRLQINGGRGATRYEVKSVNYPKRPVMAPALERATVKLPGIWADAIQQS